MPNCECYFSGNCSTKIVLKYLIDIKQIVKTIDQRLQTLELRSRGDPFRSEQEPILPRLPVDTIEELESLEGLLNGSDAACFQMVIIINAFTSEVICIISFRSQFYSLLVAGTTKN